MPITLPLTHVAYKALNSRQRENYNFAKVSAVLADYGFTTLRLSDDWQGADFIAYHVDGVQFVKVQLKGRLVVDTKYKNKDIWICFRSSKGVWYLYPHDDWLKFAMATSTITTTAGWTNPGNFSTVSGAYSWPGIPTWAAHWLSKYTLQ